jgi:formate dehydrogenase subunit gamma
MAEDKRVVKCSLGARMTHWSHTICWFVLLLTGLVMFSGWFGWLKPIFGGVNGANLLHRIFAVIFMIVPLIGLLLKPHSFIGWMKEAVRWGQDEIKFMMLFPLDFLGFKVYMPPQDRINAGQKFNSLLFPVVGFFIALSGIVMWFAQHFPIWMVRLSYPIHDLCWILGTAQVCFHAYLGSLHPGSGESFWAMFGDGTVKASWAKHHHTKWYEEVYGKD